MMDNMVLIYNFFDGTASNSVVITWGVIGVVLLLIIGTISVSLVTIMLSRFHAKRSEHLLYKYYTTTIKINHLSSYFRSRPTRSTEHRERRGHCNNAK